MRRTLAVISLIAATLGLGACGNPSSSSPNSPSPANADYVGWQTVDINGTQLLCVRLGNGASCDWVKYHLDRGDLARPSTTAKS